MTKPDAMFWSGETFANGCHRSSSHLCPSGSTARPIPWRSVPKFMCRPMTRPPTRRRSRCASSAGRRVHRPARPVCLSAHRRDRFRTRGRTRLHFDPRQNQISWLGQCFGFSCRSGLSRPTDLRRLQCGADADSSQARAAHFPDLVCEPGPRDRGQEGRHRPPGLDPELITGIAGELQSFAGLSKKVKDVDKSLGDRIHALEKEQTYYRVIAGLVLLLIGAAIKDWLSAKTASVPPTQATTPHIEAPAPQLQAPAPQTGTPAAAQKPEEQGPAPAKSSALQAKP